MVHQGACGHNVRVGIEGALDGYSGGGESPCGRRVPVEGEKQADTIPSHHAHEESVL